MKISKYAPYMGKHVATQKIIARHGCVLRPRVLQSVFAAIFEQAKRTQRSPDATAAELLTNWYEKMSAGYLEPRLSPETIAAVQAEAARTQMTPDAVAAQIITWWHEDLLELEKKKPAG